MLEKFLNIFRIPDLRKRIGFTLGLLAVYRLGAHIPTPGIDATSWRSSSTRTLVERSVCSTCSTAATCAS
jgi:preprotein translocase subunit SecY